MSKVKNTRTFVILFLLLSLGAFASVFFFSVNYLLSLAPAHWGYNLENSYISFQTSMAVSISLYMAVFTLQHVSNQFFFLFQNDYTKEALSDMNTIIYKISPDIPKSITKKIKNKIYGNRNLLKRQIEENNLSAKQIVCLLLINELADMLPNGKYHVYKGILNKHGAEIYKLWKFSLTYLHETEYYDTNKFAYINNSMSNMIKKAG